MAYTYFQNIDKAAAKLSLDQIRAEVRDDANEVEINEMADQIRALMVDEPVIGAMALAVVAAEIAHEEAPEEFVDETLEIVQY